MRTFQEIEDDTGSPIGIWGTTLKDLLPVVEPSR